MKRSYYQNKIQDFVIEDEHTILGHLASLHAHALEEQQRNAWRKQITILQASLARLEGHIYFEFAIPRMGKRVDNVLIVNDYIIVIEFKIGESNYLKSAQLQVIDYCLDLQNFHEGSHDKKIIPVLVATKAGAVSNDFESAQKLETCLLCNEQTLPEILTHIFSCHQEGIVLNAHEWETSTYKPTPTIIEAAQALYKGHNVKDISRSDAGAINLSRTSNAINAIIDSSKQNGYKSICFLTGVPGAGKTLAGLNIANERLKSDETEHAVFLSGNGPLVDVLREALTRDAVKVSLEGGVKIKRTEAERRAKAFIQNIHHFRDDNLKVEQVPIEKVVVFDEAQRAWKKEQVSKFMRTKKGVENFEMSEPEFLISVMDRHQDWCTIICLIGGGQEINTGEAGISEWMVALREKYPNWHVHYSSQILTDHQTYLNDRVVLDWLVRTGYQNTDLHLAVSVRSFRSEKVALFVHYLLSNQPVLAEEVYRTIHHTFPIYLTRDLHGAKRWLKQIAKGTERIGMVASSGGRRLRAEGVDVKNEIEAANWFLNDRDDVRSSYFLEEIATEFDIQGLEIDYVCLAWDINLYRSENNTWNYQNFKGTKWRKINTESAQKYLLNAYRVLLTRARQGMIIYLPAVDGQDYTRPKELYDYTYAYLKRCGIRELSAN